MAIDVHNQLQQTYDIVYINLLSKFFESPINILYKELVSVKQNQYTHNQRIVIIDDVLGYEKEKQFFFNYLYRIVNHLDITNCFVLIVGASVNTKQIILNSKPQSFDDTCFQFEEIAVSQKVLQSVTNFYVPDTICSNPWINLAIFEDGRVSSCCLIEDYSQDSITKKSLTDLVKNEDHTNLRQQFLTGVRPDKCIQCWQNEDAGKDSKRLNDNYVFRQKLFDIDWNNVYEPELLSLDIKLKNTCNLSCRICSPRFSSKWYDEMVKHPDTYPELVNFKNIKLEWRDEINEKLWNDLTKIGKNIRYITFSGGEPLLDKSHINLLQYLIDIGVSDKTNLHYNTNGTIYAAHLFSLWDKFKTVELSFSIDNTGDKFEYERYGANWDKTVKVLDQYLTLDRNIYRFNLNNTVSILNILDIYELYLFSINKNLNLSFNMLSNPQELNIVNLSQEQKTYITKKLMNINNQSFQKQLEPVLKYLNTHTNKQLTNNEVIKHLQKTDVVRNQKFESVYTELASMLTHQ